MAWKILAQRVNRNRQVTVYDFTMMTQKPGYEVCFWRDIESYADEWDFQTEQEALDKFEQICKEYF